MDGYIANTTGPQWPGVTVESLLRTGEELKARVGPPPRPVLYVTEDGKPVAEFDPAGFGPPTVRFNSAALADSFLMECMSRGMVAYVEVGPVPSRPPAEYGPSPLQGAFEAWVFRQMGRADDADRPVIVSSTTG